MVCQSWKKRGRGEGNHFFQKKELSLGMKIAILTGPFKKGEEIAKKYLKELDLPEASIFNAKGKQILNQRFNEIEKYSIGHNIFTYEKIISSGKDSGTMDAHVKISVKTKEYEKEKKDSADLKDLTNNPNLDIALKHLDKFK